MEALDAPPAEALEACRLLEGNAAEECAFGVLKTNDLVDEVACEALAEGPYRNECRFMVAEELAEAGSHHAAARKCRQTGPFERSCHQHGWFRAADQALLVSGPEGPNPEVEEIITTAVAAYGADLGDPEGVVWAAYWWAWWEGRPQVVLAACPDERCRAASLTAAARYGWIAGCEGDATAKCTEEPDCLAAVALGKELACQGMERPGTPVFRRDGVRNER